MRPTERNSGEMEGSREVGGFGVDASRGVAGIAADDAVAAVDASVDADANVDDSTDTGDCIGNAHVCCFGGGAGCCSCSEFGLEVGFSVDIECLGGVPVSPGSWSFVDDGRMV